MKRLVKKAENVNNILENFDSFRKWLVNSKYDNQLKQKTVWPLLTDYGYEGSELQPIANMFFDLEYELKDVNEVMLKEEYGSLENYIEPYMHDVLLELKNAD